MATPEQATDPKQITAPTAPTSPAAPGRQEREQVKTEREHSIDGLVDKDTYALLRGHEHKLTGKETLGLLKRCAAYFKPYKVRIAVAVFCMVIVALSAAGEAYLVKPAMDEIFVNRNVQALLIIPLALILVTLAKTGFRFGQNYFMQSAGYFVLQKLRDEMFSKIICLPVKFYENNQIGKLMSLVLNDVGMIRSSLPDVIMIIRQVFTMFALIGVVFYQDAGLAFWAVLVLPVCFFPFFYFGRRIRKLSRKDRTRQDDVSILIQEVFSGIRIVKAFATQDQEAERFTQKNKKILEVMLKQTIFNESTSSIMELIGAVGVALVLYYGGQQVISGESTPGTFFSFVAAIVMLYDPVKKLSNSNNNLQNALAGAERVFMILDSPTLQVEKGGDVVFNAKDGESFQELEFKDVTLRYSANLPPALENVSFKLKRGEKIALVGPSGAGKSSFVNLIPRFYDINSGQILLNGIDLGDYSLDSLRRNVSMVSQDSFLFNMSVADNITYGNTQGNEEALHAASKAAFAHGFIEQLSEGYATLVGERGVKLSGGQKQRLTIARAIFKDSPLLILDEATSALDSESERIVQKALENLMENRTSIVIAHRLSTILSSDRILVMDKGRIVAQGSHQELLQSSPLYTKLYNMQFGAAQQG